MSLWCRLSILTDEVSQELATVIRFAQEFGLEGIELRSLSGKAFRDLTPAEIREVRQRCDDAGLAVSGAATPVFKCALDDPAQIAEHTELFRRAVESAQVLGCTVVRVFTFLRRSHPAVADDLAQAAEHFHPLLEIAREAGVLVGVENEASCVVGTGGEMREFLSHLPPSPALGVVWDPCNVLFLPDTEEPVAVEFGQVSDRVAHVHVKDARREGSGAATTCVELGTGEIDFPRQFSLLRAQGYRGWVTLETHWRGAAVLDEASQHLPAGHAFTAGAELASRICMAHLQRMLADAS